VQNTKRITSKGTGHHSEDHTHFSTVIKHEAPARQECDLIKLFSNNIFGSQFSLLFRPRRFTSRSASCASLFSTAPADYVNCVALRLMKLFVLFLHVSSWLNLVVLFFSFLLLSVIQIYDIKYCWHITIKGDLKTMRRRHQQAPKSSRKILDNSDDEIDSLCFSCCMKSKGRHAESHFQDRKSFFTRLIRDCSPFFFCAGQEAMMMMSWNPFFERL
jgi:hypothetical protein